MKHIVRDVQGTLVYEVLHTSEHTDDVFFFYKGLKDASRSSRDTWGDEDDFELELKIGFIKLEHTQEELDRLGEIRHI